MELLICCIDILCGPSKCLSMVKPLKLRWLLSPVNNTAFFPPVMQFTFLAWWYLYTVLWPKFRNQLFSGLSHTTGDFDVIFNCLRKAYQASLLTTISQFESTRCRTLLVEKQESLRSWHHKMPPYIGRHLSIKSFVEDSVSPLLHILSPPNLRPVCFHLFAFSFLYTYCYFPSLLQHLYFHISYCSSKDK